MYDRKMQQLEQQKCTPCYILLKYLWNVLIDIDTWKMSHINVGN